MNSGQPHRPSTAAPQEAAITRGRDDEFAASGSPDWGRMTLGQALHHCVEQCGNRELLVFPGERIRARAFAAEVARLARGLLALGVQAGEHVAAWLPNLREYAVLEFALGQIGAAMVPINIRYKTSELEYVLGQSDSMTLVLHPCILNIDFLSLLQKVCPELPQSEPGRLKAAALPKLRRVITLGEAQPGLLPYAQVLQGGETAATQAALQERERAVRAEQPVILQYTSGTTAFPKAVVLGHGQVLRNAWHMAMRAGIGAEDRVLSAMPMFHVGGSVCALLGSVTTGYTLYLGPAFDAAETLRIIEEEQITTYVGLESMFQAIRGHPNFTRRSRQSLRRGWAAGTSSILRMVAEEIGVGDICSLYGLSEGSPNVTICHWRDPQEKRIGTMGRPQPGVEVKIIQPESKEILRRNQRGEICVRGWNVMQGYYRQPEETAAAIDAEGWLHTGDLGYLDEDGYLVWCGRTKDMLRVGGENVSALEVENFLCGHDAVLAAAVVGVPDARWGEVVLAFVQLRAGAGVTAEELVAYCKERIAPFKVPRHVRFVENFEMTGSGKIQKYLMRERVLADLAAPPSPSKP